jgi:hypothetical protein
MKLRNLRHMGRKTPEYFPFYFAYTARKLLGKNEKVTINIQ